MRILIVIGLPGSGKTTHVLNHLKQDDNFFIDDFSLNLDKIKEFKESGLQKLIIADPQLCFVDETEIIKTLKSLVSEKFLYEIIYFENNVEQCIKNIKNRNDGRLISEFIMRNVYTKHYVIPKYAITLPVYCDDNSIYATMHNRTIIDY